MGREHDETRAVHAVVVAEVEQPGPIVIRSETCPRFKRQHIVGGRSRAEVHVVVVKLSARRQCDLTVREGVVRSGGRAVGRADGIVRVVGENVAMNQRGD